MAKLDFFAHLSGGRRFGAQILVAIGALGLVAVFRFLLDLWAHGAAPYALAFPGIVLAVLVGRARAGLIAWAFIFGYLWYDVLPHGPNLSFANPLDLPRTIINAVVGLIMIGITEIAHQAATSVVAEREARLRERDMLLGEFDHRLKNNLAILSSLIAMQVRDAQSAEVREALNKAAGRIMSLGRTYDHLRYEPGTITVIDTGHFLDSLCVSLRESLALDGRITLHHSAHRCFISRDRAAALALLINEIVTNAVKHAFAGRDGGRIDVTLTCASDNAEIIIRDDGVGMPKTAASARGQGQRLLHALAKMAQCDLTMASDGKGTRYRLKLSGVASGNPV